MSRPVGVKTFKVTLEFPFQVREDSDAWEYSENDLSEMFKIAFGKDMVIEKVTVEQVPSG